MLIDLNPGPSDQESSALPLDHGISYVTYILDIFKVFRDLVLPLFLSGFLKSDLTYIKLE